MHSYKTGLLFYRIFRISSQILQGSFRYWLGEIKQQEGSGAKGFGAAESPWLPVLAPDMWGTAPEMWVFPPASEAESTPEKASVVTGAGPEARRRNSDIPLNEPF